MDANRFMKRKADIVLKCTLFVLLMFSFFLKGNGQNILPSPTHVEQTASGYTIGNQMALTFDFGTSETADYVKNKLSRYIRFTDRKQTNHIFSLHIDKALTDLGTEGYILTVSPAGIAIKAGEEAGLFYGIQSLLQLFPEEVQAGKPYQLKGFQLAGLQITDKPKYNWRGFMLDCATQYQTPELIKHYLDLMAMLKMNIFHWHLTETKGWRLEIKKYPELTKLGSNIGHGEGQQGYYSRKDIKDIVGYARRLHITVVPEIDLPGHAQAALYVYPWLGCFNERPNIEQGNGEAVFCAGKEQTYHFLEDVLDEVCELFPSEYVHLGQDEASKANWQKCPDCQRTIRDNGLAGVDDLQKYFFSRLANHLKTKNKKAIAWGDIIYQEGIKLPDNTVIMWWNYRGHKDLEYQNALKDRYPVICNTNYYNYLNFTVDHWHRMQKEQSFDLRKTYEENPVDFQNPPPLVMGMECSLWTWRITKKNMIDRRVFPRIYSSAEQMWSTADRLSFSEFYKKIKAKYPLLKMLGVEYGPALREEVVPGFQWE